MISAKPLFISRGWLGAKDGLNVLTQGSGQAEAFERSTGSKISGTSLTPDPYSCVILILNISHSYFTFSYLTSLTFIYLFLLGMVASKSLPSLQVDVLGEKNTQNSFLYPSFSHEKGM